MDRSRLGLVIPAFNESASIKSIIEAAMKYGVPIVVNDGSTDKTADIAYEAGATVVTHIYNLGYDAALNSGFRKASEIGCDVIVTMDADGQHDPTLIDTFLDRINAGADVVVGTRNNRQRLAEHLFAWYTSSRYGIHDPLCGMKAYKIDIYRALGHFDAYGSVGTELMLFAAKRNHRIDQIPFEVLEREGKSRFGSIITANYKIFRAMIFSIFQSY
jgi:glycosyltransferase involved in cell wall biosynthesis